MCTSRTDIIAFMTLLFKISTLKKCPLEDADVICLQLSSRERQLEQAQASLRDEVRKRDKEAQEKDKDLQEVNRQNTQLSESAR